MKLTTFYRLLKEFVEHFPAQREKCKQLHTCAALADYSELSAENLAKTINDKNKPYFYSRSWAQMGYPPSDVRYTYPGLFTLERGFTLSKPFSKRSGCFTIELLFADVLNNECTDCKSSYCADRVANDIYNDTFAFLMTFLKYLNTWVYVNDSGWVSGLFIPEGTDIDEKKTRYFHDNLRRTNEQLNGTRWAGSSDDIYGTLIEITLCDDDCGMVDYNPSYVANVEKLDRCC